MTPQQIIQKLQQKDGLALVQIFGRVLATEDPGGCEELLDELIASGNIIQGADDCYYLKHSRLPRTEVAAQPVVNDSLTTQPTKASPPERRARPSNLRPITPEQREKASADKQAILAYLGTVDEASGSQIRVATGVQEKDYRNRIVRLEKAGKIVRGSVYGAWRIAGAPAAAENDHRSDEAGVGGRGGEDNPVTLVAPPHASPTPPPCSRPSPRASARLVHTASVAAGAAGRAAQGPRCAMAAKRRVDSGIRRGDRPDLSRFGGGG